MEIYEIGEKIFATGNYIFFDTETANSNQDICQIGAIVVENGVIIDKLNTYVKPYDKFEYISVKTHGITPNIVEKSPDFYVVWKDFFQKYINDFVFVAHNADFDVNAIDKSLQVLNINCETFKYICSQELAEKYMASNISKSRESLCGHFNLKMEKSHDAYSDAIDCMNIFRKLYEKYDLNINEAVKYYAHKSYNRKIIEEKNLYETFKKYENKRFSAKDVNSKEQNAESDLDFVGQVITISGDFSRFKTRDELANLIHKLGAKKICSSGGLAKSTTMLIIGEKAGGKKEKAKALGIKIIEEETFYKMLDNGNEKL